MKKTEDDRFSMQNNIVSSSINADVIIQGSSRCRQHVNPLVLDTILNCSSFNIGIEGSKFNKIYFNYLFFEQFNEKPKYILQQVDFFTLFTDNDFDDRYLPYLSDIDKDLVKTHLPWVKNYHLLVPLSRYTFQKKNIMKGFIEFFNIKNISHEKTKGFVGIDKTWNSTLFYQNHRDSFIVFKDPQVIDLLDSFLNHCKNSDIKVVLFTSPIYYKATEITKGKKEVFDIYISLSEKYNIPFLNYTSNSICYDTSYFYDTHHLNTKGAELFSIKLAFDLDSLEIIKY